MWWPLKSSKGLWYLETSSKNNQIKSKATMNIQCQKQRRQPLFFVFILVFVFVARMEKCVVTTMAKWTDKKKGTKKKTFRQKMRIYNICVWKNTIEMRSNKTIHYLKIVFMIYLKMKSMESIVCLYFDIRVSKLKRVKTMFGVFWFICSYGKARTLPIHFSHFFFLLHYT